MWLGDWCYYYVSVPYLLGIPVFIVLSSLALVVHMDLEHGPIVEARPVFYPHKWQSSSSPPS
eukprot:10861125-Karenia_brevis.AAC.1